MEFRADIIITNAGAIAEGVCMTLLLTCFSFLVALALGTVVGVLRRRAGPLSALLGGYVSFFRGTPLLIQLFLIYYGLPSIGLNMPRYVAAVRQAIWQKIVQLRQIKNRANKISLYQLLL